MRARTVILVLFAACSCGGKSTSPTGPTTPDGQPPTGGKKFVIEFAGEDQGVALVKGDTLVVHSDGLLEVIGGDQNPNAGFPHVAKVEATELDTLRRLLEDAGSLTSTENPGEGRYTILTISEEGAETRALDFMEPLPEEAKPLVAELGRLRLLAWERAEKVKPLSGWTVVLTRKVRGGDQVMTIQADGKVKLERPAEKPAVASVPPTSLARLASLLASPTFARYPTPAKTTIRFDVQSSGSPFTVAFDEGRLGRVAWYVLMEAYDVHVKAKLPYSE